MIFLISWLYIIGLGFADIENRVLCSPDTVMRIASISKSITMTAVAKLWEQGKLDLDKPVQEYVPSFPQKYFNGKPVSLILIFTLIYCCSVIANLFYIVKYIYYLLIFIVNTAHKLVITQF